MSVPTGWAAFCSGVLSCLLGLVAAADEPWSDQDGLGFIATYCVDCHQPPKPKGGLDLSGQTSREHWVGHALEWEKHLPRVRDNEMPPDDEGFLSHLPRSASHFCNGPRIPSGQQPAKMVFSQVLPSCGASIEVNIPLRCGIFWTFTLMQGKPFRRMELEGRVLTMLLKRSSFPHSC